MDTIRNIPSNQTSAVKTEGARRRSVSTADQYRENATESKDAEAANTNLSSRAREINTAKKTAQNAPDIRDEQRISALKEEIANGTYKVDAKKAAEGLVRETLFDHIAMNEQI